MIVFCNAKVNIGLRINGNRSDGFHDLQSYFLPVPIKDALEIIDADHDGLRIFMSGTELPESGGANICTKVYDVLSEKFKLSGLDLHLLKTIPVGAGMGGGSSNAAAMLHLLNDKFGLGIENEELRIFAAKLGSDVPFFIDNVPSMVSGRGEVLDPFNVDLSNYWMQIIDPGIHCSTAQIFGGHSIDLNTEDLNTALLRPVADWQDNVFNDLEKAAFDLYPDIGSLKNSFYDRGALYASMSGSGSSVFGIFKDEPRNNMAAKHQSWTFKL